MENSNIVTSSFTLQEYLCSYCVCISDIMLYSTPNKTYFHANMFRLMNRDSKMCKDFLSLLFPNPYFNNIFTKHDKDLSSPFFFPKFSCTFPLWSIVINQWIVIEDPCVHILNDILCLLLFVWYLHEEGSKVFHALLLFLYILFFLFCRKFLYLLKRFMSPSFISYWFA